MWSNIFIRLIRRKLVLGLILAFSALYCIVSFWQEVRTLPEHHFEVQHSMFYLLNNKVRKTVCSYCVIYNDNGCGAGV